MKKYLISGLLCFIVSLSFGQKKAVTSAKNEIKGSNPNIAEARNTIKGALANPETSNDAETWFVAGQIENKQFDKEREKELLSKKADEEVMYKALEGIIPYFLKAAELDQLPDEKGKIKPRFIKDIRSIIKANRPFYINAGIYANDNQDYKKAYENFKLYGDIPKLSIYDGENWIISDRDTTELQIRYYAGLVASFIPDSKSSIAIFEEIKDKGYNENEIYQRLTDEYLKTGDTISYKKTAEQGFLKFPSEEFFLKHMINICIESGNIQQALTHLNAAIAQHPDNPQLYDVLGQLYETDNNSEGAIKNLKKALEFEPNNIEFLSHLGRVYFNLGVEKRRESDESPDSNKSKDLFKQSTDYFKESMPYFERIFDIDSKNVGAVFALRSIYYSLTMNSQYEKMDALYNSLSGE